MCSQYFPCWIYLQQTNAPAIYTPMGKNKYRIDSRAISIFTIFKIQDILIADIWVYDEGCIKMCKVNMDQKYDYTAGNLGWLCDWFCLRLQIHFSQATLSLRALSASLPYDQMAMLHTLSLLCFPLILLIQQIFSLIVYLFFFFSVQRKVD